MLDEAGAGWENWSAADRNEASLKTIDSTTGCAMNGPGSPGCDDGKYSPSYTPPAHS